jgi:hypothetical protein
VVGRAIYLSYRGLLPVIRQHRVSLFAIFSMVALEEEEVARTMLSSLNPRSSLGVIGSTFTGGVQGPVSFDSHYARSGCDAASSKWKSKRLEGKREKQWDLVCTMASIFICVICNSVMIRFPRKRCLSVSTTRAVWSRNHGRKKT